jgi:hypothetical protein
VDASKVVDVGTIPATGCSTVRAVFDEGSALLSKAPDWHCPEQPPHVEFHRLINGAMVTLGGFDLPLSPYEQTLAKRAGGYWYSASNHLEGVVVYALDQNGAPLGPPWTDSYTFGDSSATFQPWRHGFVVSRRTMEGISVFVSDGYNLTASDAQPFDGSNANSEIAMVVGGEDEKSILFAYPTFDGVALLRADCTELPFK